MILFSLQNHSLTGNKIAFLKYIPVISSFSIDSTDIENIAEKGIHSIMCNSYILNHFSGETMHFVEEKKMFANSVTLTECRK